MIVGRILLSLFALLAVSRAQGEVTPRPSLVPPQPTSSSGPVGMLEMGKHPSRAMGFKTFASAKPTLSEAPPFDASVAQTAQASTISFVQPQATTPRPVSVNPPPAPSQPSTNMPAKKGDRLVFGKSKEKSPPSERNHLFAQLASWRPSSETLVVTGGGLAVSVGLLLAASWVIKKSLPRSARPLPSEVAEQLGRFPLAGKQVAQLLRVGNKLVLVAISADGAKTLTEITDPEEVQRLLATCDEHNGRGSSADFDKIFNEMTHEPARGGFFGDDDRFDPRALADAYSNTPGGRASA